MPNYHNSTANDSDTKSLRKSKVIIVKFSRSITSSWPKSKGRKCVVFRTGSNRLRSTAAQVPGFFLARPPHLHRDIPANPGLPNLMSFFYRKLIYTGDRFLSPFF